jgi:signal transduction histidine kinase
MRKLWPIALVAIAAAGAASETATGSTAAHTTADLATGWTLLACSAWGLAHRPRQARWALLGAAGAAWFAANLALGALAYLHRGPLVHAAVAARGEGPSLAATRTRLGGRSVLAVAAISVGYADALALGAAHGWLDVIVAVLLVALALRADARLAGALLALAGALAIGASTALTDASAGYDDIALYAYEAAICAGALLLASTATRGARATAGITDLVVELGPARRSPRARDALARALGDPTLEIAYWLGDARAWVDLEGNPVALPAEQARRATTMVEHDGERIAALVHDVALLDDPELVGAVRDAAGLILANDRLEAAAVARLVELRGSRRRIVAARDTQRARISGRLHEGPARRLAGVAATVHEAGHGKPPTEEQAELLELIDRELVLAQSELDELARGIHPRVLTEQGLAAALATLAERAPFAVAVSAPGERLPAPVEATAYFVCSEALANAAKHADGTRARCEVVVHDGLVRVEVADDGVGGADPAGGSGLRGLADRVETAGGTLTVSSPEGQGTTIRAELPCSA